MPIGIEQFANSMRFAVPHPTLFLTFNSRSAEQRLDFAAVTPVEGKEYNGLCEAASWYYTLGELDVQITWFAALPIRNVPFAWHPSDAGKVLTFRGR
jgi:hypothetical protein